MDKPSEEAVQEAIKTILADTDKYHSSLKYAINYCKAAHPLSGEALRVQCLYILSNITGWRHPKAKEVRKIFRGFSN